jgi:FtsZ-binding cell division protein ZapB
MNFSIYERSKQKLKEEDADWKPINMHHLELIRKIEIIIETITLLKDTIDDVEENLMISEKELDSYLHDVYIVTAKLSGALNCEFYLIYMENASVIRFYMRQLETFVNGIDFFQDYKIQHTIDKDYIEVLQHEIKSFKESFGEWTACFEKDEFIDDWNLY